MEEKNKEEDSRGGGEWGRRVGEGMRTEEEKSASGGEWEIRVGRRRVGSRGGGE